VSEREIEFNENVNNYCDIRTLSAENLFMDFNFPKIYNCIMRSLNASLKN
jgi:hypothetical protein